MDLEFEGRERRGLSGFIQVLKATRNACALPEGKQALEGFQTCLEAALWLSCYRALMKVCTGRAEGVD